MYRYCLWIYIGLALLMAITCFFCVILDRTCVKMQCLIRAWYVRQFAYTIAVNYALSRYIGRCHPSVPSTTLTPSVPSLTVRWQYLRIRRQMFYASLLTLSLEFNDNSSTWIWWQPLSSFTVIVLSCRHPLLPKLMLMLMLVQATRSVRRTWTWGIEASSTSQWVGKPY